MFLLHAVSSFMGYVLDGACCLLTHVRYVNLGAPGRPLATDDPMRTDVLPVDDTMWDQGEMTTSEPLYVSSPTSVKASPFARTCQASHLLGRLIRHLNDCNADPVFRFTEAGQLRKLLSLSLSSKRVSVYPGGRSVILTMCSRRPPGPPKPA